MSKLAKLDTYNYHIIPGFIRIKVRDRLDASLVDILGEIDTAGGNIYVEGMYFSYLDNYYLWENHEGTWLDLEVIEVDASYDISISEEDFSV